MVASLFLLVLECLFQKDSLICHDEQGREAKGGWSLWVQGLHGKFRLARATKWDPVIKIRQWGGRSSSGRWGTVGLHNTWTLLRLEKRQWNIQGFDLNYKNGLKEAGHSDSYLWSHHLEGRGRGGGCGGGGVVRGQKFKARLGKTEFEVRFHCIRNFWLERRNPKSSRH